MRGRIFYSILIVILTTFTVLLTSCGGGDNTGGNSKPSDTKASSSAPSGGTVVPTSSTGTMTAKIDGKTWTAAVVSIAYSYGFLEIGGMDSSSPAQTLGINVEVNGPGTYELSQLEEASAFALMTIGDSSWQASNVVGSGTVIVSTLTSTGASGTFSLNLEPKPNNLATGTKAITDGIFNITFTTTGITPSAAPGGVIAAQVNGQAFSGKVVAASFTDQFLTLKAADSQGNIIDIEIGSVIGSGTYSLASHNPSSSSAYFKFRTGDTWGTVLPGGTGSAIITSIDSGRVVGTFSFDGPDETGSGSGLVHVTDGRFDVTY
jgi:hypothetical protein